MTLTFNTESGAREVAGMVQLLLMAGADVSIRDGKGRQPVDLAAKNEQLKGTEVYRQLSEAGY